MIKHILLAGLLLFTFMDTGAAWYGSNVYCWDQGDEYGVYTVTGVEGGNYRMGYHSSGNAVTLFYYHNMVTKGGGYATAYIWGGQHPDCGQGGANWVHIPAFAPRNGSFQVTTQSYELYVDNIVGTGAMTFVVAPPATEYDYIKGNSSCVGETDIYIYNGVDYVKTQSTTGNTYEFQIINGSAYKLSLDSHDYVFTAEGTNVTYDYDACINTHYRFEELCGNLIPDSEGHYIEKIGPEVYAANYFYAHTGILTILESPADSIYISAKPFSGQIGWFLDPIVNDTTYTLTNPHIAWSLKVIVMNESDDTLIDGAMVKVDQTCYCSDKHSTRNKKTVSGMASFGEMSLQDASFFVMKSGYKILDEDTTGYSAFLSGRTNFSSKTWVAKLAPSESANASTLYEVQNKVDIHFRDVNGNRTSKILDTDAYVDLYYENNNTDEESMTMKFQYSSTHSYFIDALSWTIPHDTIGHKRILNANFSNPDYAYRAVIYNSSIYGWNITIPLTVRNETKEEELHYENLTTTLWFMNAYDGKIDYREDMEIVCHASSENSTLLNIDIELYDNSVLVDYENLTAIDFTGADFKWFYQWNPATSYTSGHNYTVKMFGFDRTLLETASVECITDDITRKNKITILVKDHYGTNLTDSTVYLEGWTELSTGSTNYNSYEGVDDGTYYYSASKSGYAGTGLSSVIVSGEDEIVWYTLTATLPPAPINIANTTGNLWVNHTWEPGVGIVTDSYNVRVNDVWHNTTTDTFYNDTYAVYEWQNITVYAYNSSGTGSLSETSISQNTQIAQNEITNIHATTLVYDRIVWEWINPDYYDTIMVYLDNTWKQNITGTSYSASGLAQTTAYTIKLISVYEGTERTPVTDTQVTPSEQGGGGGGDDTPTPTPSPEPTPTPTPSPDGGGGGGGIIPEPEEHDIEPDETHSGTCVDGVTMFNDSMVISVKSPGCISVTVYEYYLNPTTTSLIGGTRYGYSSIEVDGPELGGTVTFRVPDGVIDIAVYQMEDKMWIELPNTRVGNTIIVNVDRFGFFALAESGMESVIESMTQLSLTPPKVSGILFYGWTDTYTSRHIANRKLESVSSSDGITCEILTTGDYSNRTLVCTYTPREDGWSSLKYVGEVIAIDSEGYTRRIPISILVYNMGRLGFPLLLLIILIIGYLLYRKYD